MNECDIKFLDIIIQIINDFEEKNEFRYLPKLINDLSKFINVMKYVDPGRYDLLIKQWSCLEVIYAVALYEERDFFDSQDQKLIADALPKIKNLVLEEKLNQAKQFKGEMGILAEENWIICPYCFEPLEPPQIDLVLICPKCDRYFRNPLQQ